MNNTALLERGQAGLGLRSQATGPTAPCAQPRHMWTSGIRQVLAGHWSTLLVRIDRQTAGSSWLWGALWASMRCKAQKFSDLYDRRVSAAEYRKKFRGIPT